MNEQVITAGSVEYYQCANCLHRLMSIEYDKKVCYGCKVNLNLCTPNVRNVHTHELIHKGGWT